MKELEKYLDEIEKNSIDDSKIDTGDIPELTAEDFARGHFKNWKPVKKVITVRIDADNLYWLKSQGSKGYQTKMNSVIRWARNNGCPISSL